MSEAKKKLFGLFRRDSYTEKPEKSSRKEKERRHRRVRPHTSHASQRSPGRAHTSHSPHPKSEPRRSTGSYGSNLSPLTEWPPAGLPRDAEISQGRAMELIASGVPVFKGHKRMIPHASDEYYLFYATCEGNGGAGDDREVPYNDAFLAHTCRLRGNQDTLFAWDTLEQPSMAFCYGNIPGTITLNHWVGMSASLNPPIELRDPGVKPRDVELSTILERLVFLQGGFEEDYEELMYKNLYKTLLRDPEKFLSPHKAMEKQIADLIIVLSRREWIDFSKPENQVVAKFFANAAYTDQGRYKMFFHQLLLGMELDMRIQSKQHTEYAKEKLLSQLPPSISWNLMLARKWQECMSIEKFNTGGDPEQIRFHLKSKKAQVKALRKFARVMKWPNLAKVDEVLKERDPDDGPLEDRSSDAMSYFTGMVLPGCTLPWLIMNTLIDCDNDASADSLAALTHMYPNSGFQYKSTTYWSASSIVGKVLAPTCHQIGGWIGPCRPAPDLDRIQIARIRQRRPKQRMEISDIESMTERSDPLGPPSSAYPVSEYQLILPDLNADYLTNSIRIEKLALKPVSATAASGNSPDNSGGPLTFDAAVQFAIDGRSWPLRLSYDVAFVAAFPCKNGPHPCWFDYGYRAIRIDDILTVRDWGGLSTGRDSSIGASSTANGGARGDARGGAATNGEVDDVEAEKVLVVEAFGVPDNEVLARAWCSHWGLGAVVANVEKTCMSCAIREAYAACLNVVILIEGPEDSDQ